MINQNITLLSINSHKGLFRYNHLPFGVASALSIFQCHINGMLQGILALFNIN